MRTFSLSAAWPSSGLWKKDYGMARRHTRAEAETDSEHLGGKTAE
jgi:hypothetical protein